MTRETRAMKAWWVILVLWLCASACINEDPRVVVGREFPIERLSAIQKGISTRAGVRDLFGEPYKTERLSDRQERWRYFMRRERQNAILFVIPGSLEVTENEVNIVFDGNFVESVDRQVNEYTE